MKKILGLLLAIFTLGVLVAGCTSTTSKEEVLKIGATAVPHAEILEKAKPILEKEGVKLDIVVFNDYVQPNMALNDGEIDANYFQHVPYLDEFNKEHNLNLVSVGGVHLEPMGIYSKTLKDLNDLPNNAKIAIPNDPTNGGRALLLLDKAGIIKLKDNANLTATVNDIVANPKNVKITEVEAAQLPRTLEDVNAAVINTNYAIQADLNPTKDALVIEDASSPYVNIVVVKQGNENDARIKKLLNVLQSKEIQDFINEKYQGAIVATTK